MTAPLAPYAKNAWRRPSEAAAAGRAAAAEPRVTVRL